MKTFLEHSVLLMQTLWYVTGIAVLLFLANVLWQQTQANRLDHVRADATLMQSQARTEHLLTTSQARTEQLLTESRQFLLDHQRIMQRLSEGR